MRIEIIDMIHTIKNQQPYPHNNTATPKRKAQVFNLTFFIGAAIQIKGQGCWGGGLAAPGINDESPPDSVWPVKLRSPGLLDDTGFDALPADVVPGQ
jgi:hypothetical protein